MKVDSLFNLTLEEITLLLKKSYGKGEFHGKGLFSHIYRKGDLSQLENSPGFKHNPALAKKIQKDFPLKWPLLVNEKEEEGTVKALLEFPDGSRAESVFIPMFGHNTLCLSSQVGCGRGCSFCRTANMGLVRDLTAGEIVAQVMYHLFKEKRELRNIVFMGMGEPLDNFDNVIRAIDILTDPRGLSLNKKFISLSTCGQVDGLKRLIKEIQDHPEKQYSALRLAISINSADNNKRNTMMPVNKIWPLEVLKETLKGLPQSREKNRLYFEYVLISGVNDGQEDAKLLLDFLEGLGGKVNLIPLHDSKSDQIPSQDSLNNFWQWIRAGGRECRTRKSKGQSILAACGQLATE